MIALLGTIVEALMSFDSVARASYCYSSMSTAPREATGRNSSGQLGGLRILVIDDHEDARELVALILERAGAAVQRVDSAKMARSVLAKAPLDVLVSDIGMPFEDGYELIGKVRRGEVAPDNRSIPALAVTAFCSAKDRNDALVAGFQEHLAKPIESDKLVAAVARIAAPSTRAEATSPEGS